MKKEELHLSLLIMIIVCLISFFVGINIAVIFKNKKIIELTLENNRLKDLSVKKSAMMLSYHKGWNDGMLAPYVLYESTLSFRKNQMTLSKLKEHQAMKFLEDNNILNIQTSNYMIKVLEKIK